MAISKGKNSISIEEVSSLISDIDIVAYYLNITTIPILINSPLRPDNNPSFRLFSPDGKTIIYTFNNISTWNIGKFIKDFNEAFNLSVGMFAGVGIDNGKPTEIGYMVANLEMLIGIVLMGVGVGTLTRKAIR